jgi:Bacterial aa3 type cytochrome c oxidase subunit IV
MASNGDMKQHEQTYGGVMAMLKWGTIGCAIIAFIVVLLIAN